MRSEHSPAEDPVSYRRSAAPGAPAGIVRRRSDRYSLAGGLLLATTTAVAASGPVRSWEGTLFRACNGLSGDFQWAAWPFQQLGMALAIPAGAVLLGRLARSWRPPLVLIAVAVVLGWGAANAIRDAVGRPRPAAILSNVRLGWDVPTSGMAFPSGHTIVAAALATVLAPYLASRANWLMAGLVLLVALVRMYAGAHLPLDLIGGAACGVVVGSTVNLIAGIFIRQPAGMGSCPDG